MIVKTNLLIIHPVVQKFVDGKPKSTVENMQPYIAIQNIIIMINDFFPITDACSGEKNHVHLYMTSDTCGPFHNYFNVAYHKKDSPSVVHAEIDRRLTEDGLNPQCSEEEKLLYLWKLYQHSELLNGVVAVHGNHKSLHNQNPGHYFENCYIDHKDGHYGQRSHKTENGCYQIELRKVPSPNYVIRVVINRFKQ
ncbi:hypothetical protein KUTeg_002680 [Tegillarca granosa]|uniref:Uncharacterized protein n=1 Tax=Tegillarca granosa TaxID=220873 RepID=A0ABQ9FV08_TEGGR|nr:hypothetical protein KUTeg_002680 [Tegillarca granosa]